MLKLLVLGHRGAGKSSFLKKIEQALDPSPLVFFNLDEVVEKKAGKTIMDIFAQQGEPHFRQLEIECLQELIQTHSDSDIVIDLGAGFSGEKPPGFQCLWLQRSIDLSQALFLNRPTLDKNLTMAPERFAAREKRYADWADFQLLMREGVFHSFEPEVQYFKQMFLQQPTIPLHQPWIVTILSEQHAKELSQLGRIDDLFFELRDDLLSPETIERLHLQFPLRTLISCRDKSRAETTARILDSSSFWDWPLEWGSHSEASILSLHERQDDLAKTLAQFPQTEQILKLAVPIHNFKELEMGFRWAMEDVKKRAFLPNSKNGRWAWFRLEMAKHNPINFLREAQGSSADQPTLLDVLAYDPTFKHFAAILASPAKHSFTPSFHTEFFSERSANVLRIDVDKSEWNEALPFLTELGLRWSAVSSPNKEVAAQMVNSPLPAVNTLFFNGSQWMGTNTDIHGFSEVIANYKNHKVAVWGGGGVIPAIEANLPNATFYSSRTGAVKKGESLAAPDIVVWAVGGSQFRQQGVYPPISWRPQFVVDLNYAHNSPGIECAHKLGCQYRSGLDMFIAQAKKQQEYWNECWFK